MARRKDRTEYGKDEFAFIRDTTHAGRECNPAYVREINQRFHHGLPVRTLDGIRAYRQKKGWKLGEKPEAVPEEVREQEVKQQETADGVDVVCVGRQIRTLDEAIAFVKLDLRKYEVHQPEATSWTVVARNADGQLATVQNHRIAFKARLKTGPNVQEQVEAILEGAFAKRKPVTGRVTRPAKSDLLQGVVIADPHIGKLCWPEGTGGEPYDTGIACAVLRDGVSSVMARGDERGVGERHLWLVGDYFHHDGQGVTTKGTPLDYDSRVQKMLREGSEVLFDLIAASAEKMPTRVILVPGNHDTVLTWALQRILVSEFRKHRGVTIDDTSTTTKYHQHGKCLIGLNHGDKGKKRLHEVMAADCAVEWGQTICRHIHTGHLHGKAKVETVGGVVIWTHDSLSPADQWHASEQFGVNPRTIEGFVYHSGGMFVGSDAWSPDLNAQPKRGTVR